MDSRRITPLLSLPAALLVREEVLGSTHSVEIGGVQIGLTFPRIDPNSISSDWPKLVSGLGDTGVAHNRMVESLNLGWGDRTNNSWGVRALSAAFDVSTDAHPRETPEAGTVADNLEAWLTLAREWISAKGSAPMRGDRWNRDSVVHDLHGHEYWGLGAVIGGVLISGLEGASTEEVRAAFARATRGHRLPTEHRLLLDAGTHLITTDYRRAALDAGTATEVALSSFINYRLQTSNLKPGAIDAIILQANGLVGLYDLAVSLGQELPVSRARLMNELANPRNEAAHRGVAPSGERSARAVVCAREVLAKVTPLAFP